MKNYQCDLLDSVQTQKIALNGDTLKLAAAKGARYYIEPDPLVTGGDSVERWLGKNAELVARSAVGGRLFRLAQR